MKKTVLIGASLVLATSILGACGKESSTSASGETNQNISMSQVSNISINGKKLSKKDIKQYKKNYMQDTYKKMNLDTQSVIKNIALEEEMLKDLGFTQEQLDKKYAEIVDFVEKDKSKGDIDVIPQGYFLHQTLSKAYAKKYLGNDTTMKKTYNSLKGEDKKNFGQLSDSVLYDKENNSKMIDLDANYYRLYLVANKNKVVDVTKYQQDLLDKADVKGIKLSKLTPNETIF